MSTGRVVAVVGPTAVGKSDLGVLLALELGGEVVNADSMQLYRGMDIGTAKLTTDERRGVPHHLLDVWSVRETASVADYQQRARAAISELHARGALPVLVGGSGLYVRAVLDPMEFPGTDPALRAALEAELSALGSGALHARLAELDPAAAAAILPSNGRRVVRALEVIALTGKPFTARLPGNESRYDVRVVGVDTDSEALDARIGQRVGQMWERGLVEEVQRLEAEGLRAGVTASRALGYAQVLAMLDGSGPQGGEQVRADIAAATRRFARRQRSWFRRDPRVQWLAPGPGLLGEALGVASG